MPRESATIQPLTPDRSKGTHAADCRPGPPCRGKFQQATESGQRPTGNQPGTWLKSSGAATFPHREAAQVHRRSLPPKSCGTRLQTLTRFRPVQRKNGSGRIIEAARLARVFPNTAATVEG